MLVIAAHLGGYFPATEIETRLRPFALRRRRTARPDRVRIRARNPWVRFLLLLWGWYVRFTVLTPVLQNGDR